MASVTNYTTQPQLMVPSAAVGVSVTPNASAFVNSAYTQLTASIANDIVIVGVITDVGINNVLYNIDVATGAATSEAVVGTILGFAEDTSCYNTMELFFIPIFIAKNTRIAVRMRKAGADVTAWAFKLVYYEVPVVVTTVPAPLMLHAGQYMRTNR